MAPFRRTRPVASALPGAVFAVAAATFTVVTSEMLPVGLLTPIADTLRVASGTAGLAVTLPGFVAALAAPLLPVAIRGADRGTALVGLLLLLAAGNALSAAAPHLTVLLAARLLVGVSIGGIWAVAAALPARLAPATPGRATSVVFSGIAVASVAGVPAGTVVGDLFTWRIAFAAVAVLALLVAVVLAVALPPLPPDAVLRLGGLTALLRLPRLRLALLTVLFLVGGHFAAYTYVRPTLERVSAPVGMLLLGYGLAGVLGTFLAGAAAPRRPRRTLLTLVTALTATLLALAPGVGGTGVASALSLGWGLSYGGVSITAQSWVTAAAPEAREGGPALFAGVFNVAIALGSLSGGLATDHWGVAGALWWGAGLAAAALALACAARVHPAVRTADGEVTGTGATAG